MCALKLFITRDWNCRRRRMEYQKASSAAHIYVRLLAIISKLRDGNYCRRDGVQSEARSQIICFSMHTCRRGLEWDIILMNAILVNLFIAARIHNCWNFASACNLSLI